MDEELAAPGSMSLCQNATKTQELIKRKRAASICPGTVQGNTFTKLRRLLIGSILRLKRNSLAKYLGCSSTQPLEEQSCGDVLLLDYKRSLMSGNRKLHSKRQRMRHKATQGVDEQHNG